MDFPHKPSILGFPQLLNPPYLRGCEQPGVQPLPNGLSTGRKNPDPGGFDEVSHVELAIELAIGLATGG